MAVASVLMSFVLRYVPNTHSMVLIRGRAFSFFEHASCTGIGRVSCVVVHVYVCCLCMGALFVRRQLTPHRPLSTGDTCRSEYSRCLVQFSVAVDVVSCPKRRFKLYVVSVVFPASFIFVASL